MKKKRSWLKRFLLGVALLLALFAAGVALLAYYSGSDPDWYRTAEMGEAEAKKYYDSAVKKLGTMQNWAQGQMHWPAQQNRPRVDTDPTTAPAQQQSISLSEEELNAVLSKERQKLLERYGDSIANPYIAFHEGHIVLAVTHKGSGRVISVHFSPTIDNDGLLTLVPDKLTAGRIPVPKALWSGYTDKVTNILAPALENIRQNAEILSDGRWNEPAVVAGRTRLVLASIQEKPSDAVLFLPPDLRKMEEGYPVRLLEAKIADKTLSLTVSPLTSEEQQRLLLRLRAPVGEDPAPPISAKSGTPVAAK